jgi:hypothetical protein
VYVQERRLLTLAFVVLCIILVQASAATHVNAQTIAGISILPASANLYLNETNLKTVEIWVTDVVNVNTFDITFHYDPAVVALSGWEHGGIFPNPSLLRNVHDPIAGTLRLSYVQLGGAGFTGSGVLLRLTFQGISWGTSFLFMDPAQLWSVGVPVPLTVQNGEIITGYKTGVVAYTSLSGEISLQGRTLIAGIPVRLEEGLYLGYGPYETLSLAQIDDNYFFTSIVMDAYPIRTDFPYYLNLDASSNKVKGVVGSTDDMPPIVLLAGNVDNTDNEINYDDLDLIKVNFNLARALLRTGAKLVGDANGDGIVDIRDLALAGGNFGLDGSTAYADWLP